METKNFAQIVKELREKNGLTQVELANKMGLTPTGISYWEAGKAVPNYEMLKKVAVYFNVSLDYLSGNSDVNLEDDILFRKIEKVDNNKKELLMDILNKTVDSFIDNDK